MNIETSIPGDIQVERAILGGVMLDEKLYYIAARILAAEDYLVGPHRVIWSCISRLMDAKSAVDPLTVKTELAKAGKLDDAGGFGYLAALSEGIPRAQNIEAYAGIVKEKSRLRQIMAACHEASQRCAGTEADSGEIIADHLGAVRKVSSQTGNGFAGGIDVISGCFSAIEARSQDKRKVTGIPTGVQSLDELTTGFQGGDLIVISAKTGSGKTALALNCMTHAMIHWQKRPIIFSLEMSREQLGARMISSESGVDSYALRTGYVRNADWPLIIHAASQLSECKFFVHDKSISIGELDARVRQVHEESPIDFLIVDYLQLVTVGGNRRVENRTQEVTEVSRGLKAIASDLGIPVVALSQQNGDGELRESRAIEHDASLIIKIEMDKELLRQHDAVPAKIVVEKNRNGSIGQVDVSFLKRITKFVEVA